MVEQPRLPAEGQRHILPAIGEEIEPEKLDGREGDGQAACDQQPEQHDLGRPGADQEMDDLADVGKGSSTFLAASHHRGEIVVGQNQIGGRARHICALASHGHTQVRLVQGRGVIPAVAHHCNHMAGCLQSIHDPHLLSRLDTREHADSVHEGGDVRPSCCKRSQFPLGQHLLRMLGNPELADDRQGCGGMKLLEQAISDKTGRKPTGLDFIIDRRQSRPCGRAHMSMTRG